MEDNTMPEDGGKSQGCSRPHSNKEVSDTLQGIDESENTSEGDLLPRTKVTFQMKVTLFVLVIINLLNFMDRSTLAGVLTLVQKYFNINSKEAGLLNTVFVVCFMVFAPLFGYLGDRYSRKYVMAAGVLVWSAMTFVGSLVNQDQTLALAPLVYSQNFVRAMSFTWPVNVSNAMLTTRYQRRNELQAPYLLQKRQYIWFFVIRGLVGIGEASYSTVAPTIISDLFIGDQRTKALSIFYFAIPCGSGLGYIVGSKVALAAHNQWQWAFRVTPGLGVLCVILCVFVIHDPKRGALESANTQESIDDLSASMYQPTSSYWEDIKYLFKVKSFLAASVGTACVSFSIGSLAFWAPVFVLYSERSAGKVLTIDKVSYVIGIIAFVTGIVGVWSGAEIARQYRKRNGKSDALVCGMSLLASAPFLFFFLYFADKRIYVAWVLMAISDLFLFMYWTPNGDLLLYVIVPNRRSTAEAAQILFLHLFGDAVSPFIVGAISDAIRGKDESNTAKQEALFYALLVMPFISVFGAVAYYVCAEYLIKDRQAAEEAIKQIVSIPSDKEGGVDNLPRNRLTSTSSDTDEVCSEIGNGSGDENDLLIPDVAIKGGDHS
eukprot:gene13801-15246_t